MDVDETVCHELGEHSKLHLELNGSKIVGYKHTCSIRVAFT